MVLEGLLNFVDVRDFLYSRMRGAREGTHERGAISESLADVLKEVAPELRALRQTIEQQNASRGLQR
jgi:hypothetical protein